MKPPSISRIAAARRLARRVICSLALALAAGGAAAKSSSAPEVPGEILVKLRSGDALAGVLARHRLTLLDRLGPRPMFRTQVIGGARASGTNDKAGALQNLQRWTSTRSIKETFVPPTDHRYPHQG